nr:helix-turn-helix domain-containing protein [Ochrobactrum sp. CM-21-5]
MRGDLWREVTRPLFSVDCPNGSKDRKIEGFVRSRKLGSLLICKAGFNPQHYLRDRRIILDSDLDIYLLQVFTSGHLTGNFEGRSVTVDPGDICIIDMSKTFESCVTLGTTISIFLPRGIVDKATSHRNIHGLTLKACNPVTRLVSDFVASLMHNATNLSAAENSAMEETAGNFIGTILAYKSAEFTTATETAFPSLLRDRILEFIDMNLLRPELCPSLIIERFKLSRAHLYRTFTEDGGVAKIIREKRLDLAYRELLRQDEAPSAKAIAYKLGFTNSHQFLRGFNTRFGVKPSELRKNAINKLNRYSSPETIHEYFKNIQLRAMSKQDRIVPNSSDM